MDFLLYRKIKIMKLERLIYILALLNKRQITAKIAENVFEIISTRGISRYGYAQLAGILFF